MELVRKNIHMNRQKGKAISQVTLGDDYNIPEQMPDVGMVIQEKGMVEISGIQPEGGKVRVKGKLQFFALYMSDMPEDGLHSIQGQIPFEERMNVENAQDGDSLQLKWMLEDVAVSLINSRKLSIKTILTLEVAVEEIFDMEVCVNAEGCEDLQVKTCHVSTAGLAAKKKDICRIKDEILLPANKPNIRTVIWQDVALQGTELRLSEGEVLVKGELVVFILYEGEEEYGKAFWLEQILPFNSRVDVNGCQEGMLGNIEWNLSGYDLEIKPDYDGELRVLNLDAVLDLDIQIYEEQHHSMICDLYSPSGNLKPVSTPVVYEKLLACKSSRCRVSERLKIGNQEKQILQICHSRGEVKVDESRITGDGLFIEGVVSVQVLYVTSDDSQPFCCLKGIVPFEHVIEVPGMETDSIYYLQISLEQLAVSMVSSEELEVKAGIHVNTLVLGKMYLQHMTGVEEFPPDLEELKCLPGFLIYTVQKNDSLWDLAKTYHTTMEHIQNLNELNGTDIVPGQKLLLVKQIGHI